jgi:Transposase DDE domain
LIRVARPLYVADPIGVDLDHSLYALDSTTIDLCLSLFPWAKFRRHKGAVKMHTLLDLHGNIPTFISITNGKVHDVNILDEIAPEAGAFYVMDRGYVDFERLYVFTLSAAFFVVRRSLHPQSRFRDKRQISRGKLDRLPHATAGFTVPSMDMRSFARSPGTVCLRSGSCTSARTFARRFFQTLRRRNALALRYDFASIRLSKGTFTPELSNMLGTQQKWRRRICGRRRSS